MEVVLFKNREGEEHIINEYDVKLGYEKACQEAKAVFTNKDQCAPCDLTERGFQKFDETLSPGRCAELINETEQGLNDWGATRQKSEVLSILEEIFTPKIHGTMLSYFESEYVPTTVGFSKTEPAIEAVSSRWHFDGGPDQHLIVMAYLTDCEDDGAGTTLFTDLKTSEAFLDFGYGFGQNENRIDDSVAVALAHNFSVEFSPINLRTRAGDVVVFDARHVMHRGYYPKQRPRYTIALSCIPFRENWRDACENYEFPGDLLALSPPFPRVTW